MELSSCHWRILVIWILKTLSCQSVSILFLVPVPGSLYLGNDIGMAKSPEADIPPELKLKLCKLQIYWSQFSFLFLPYYELHWDMLGFVSGGYLEADPLSSIKSNVLIQRTIDQSNKTAILIQMRVFLALIFLAQVSKYFWTPLA